jgi:hypothetical protein
VVQSAAEEYVPPGTKFLHTSPHLVLFRFGGKGKTTLCIGDSNMYQYAPRYFQLLKNNSPQERGALILWSGGIPPIPGVVEKNHPATGEIINEMNHLLDEDNNIDRVVIGANWVMYCCIHLDAPFQIHGNEFPSHDAQREAISELGDLIASIRKRGKKVYLVLNTPNDIRQDPKSEMARDFHGVEKKKSDPISVEAFNGMYGAFLDAMKKTGTASGAVIIDPRDFLATNGVYPRMIDGRHLYKDACHLRATYVRDHVKYLDETMLP